MDEERALQILRKHNDWRRGGRSKQQDARAISAAIDVAVRVLARHKPAMDVLRQIADRTRRTQEQRLAKSCVVFLDALAEQPNAGNNRSEPA